MNLARNTISAREDSTWLSCGVADVQRPNGSFFSGHYKGGHLKKIANKIVACNTRIKINHFKTMQKKVKSPRLPSG